MAKRKTKLDRMAEEYLANVVETAFHRRLKESQKDLKVARRQTVKSVERLKEIAYKPEEEDVFDGEVIMLGEEVKPEPGTKLNKESK